MSGSSDKSGSASKGAGKRPVPTIEGTATEVSVEADRDEPAAGEPKSGEQRGEQVSGGPVPNVSRGSGPKKAASAGETAEETQAEKEAASSERGSKTGAPSERRSFAAVLLGGLISLFTHGFAGLLGGLAVLLAISLGYLPLGAFKDTAGIGLLEDRIAKLEAAPETPDQTASIQALEQRLAALEEKTAQTPPEVTALSQRLTQLEASLKSMSEVAKEGGSVADAAAISQQINEAERRLDARIDSKIQAEIETALAGTKTETLADTKAIDDLKAEIAQIDSKLKALTEAKLGSDQAAQLLPEIADLEDRLGRIESTLPALAKAVDEGGTETKKATLAIAFASLREAVNEGRPYTSELSTLAVLSPGALDLGSLLDYEETGIPTVRALTASFDRLRDEALAAETASEDGSLVSQLLGSAEQLVKIRRIDAAAEGSSRDAVLARAGAKLDRGDLNAAVREVEALQGQPEKTFKTWLEDAKARLDARATLRRLQSVLLVSMAPDKTEPSDSGPSGKNKTEE